MERLAIRRSSRPRRRSHPTTHRRTTTRVATHANRHHDRRWPQRQIARARADRGMPRPAKLRRFDWHAIVKTTASLSPVLFRCSQRNSGAREYKTQSRYSNAMSNQVLQAGHANCEYLYCRYRKPHFWLSFQDEAKLWTPWTPIFL